MESAGRYNGHRDLPDISGDRCRRIRQSDNRERECRYKFARGHQRHRQHRQIQCVCGILFGFSIFIYAAFNYRSITIFPSSLVTATSVLCASRSTFSFPTLLLTHTYVSRSTCSSSSSQFLLYIYVGPIYWSTIPLYHLWRFEEYILGISMPPSSTGTSRYSLWRQ